ncbi:MAG: hypothetical protein AB8B53_00765 [Flavobacteriales bacterium]
MNTLKRKPLHGQALIYDKDCPMCCVYTSAFIKAGVLDENGREPYNDKASDSEEWDAERAKNEIALVNYENGTVTYGIDSMFTVVGHRFGFLKPLFGWKPFHWCMKKFYSFISYNRKVIAPPARNAAKITCIPDVDLKYRGLYLLFAWITSAVILAGFTSLLEPLVPASTFWREILICGGQIIFQTAALLTIRREEKTMDYLGNMMTVSLEGALLLTPLMLLNYLWAVPAEVAMVYFFSVVLFMFVIHYRRVKSIGLGVQLCLTWLFYRVMLLPIILWV